MVLCRQWLTSLPEPTGILKNLQLRGRESLASLGVPSKEHESWRLTDLDRIEHLLKLPVSSPSKEAIPEKNDSFADEPINGIQLVLDPQKNPLDSFGKT